MIFFVFTLLFFFRGHSDGGAPPVIENDYLLVVGRLRRFVSVAGMLRTRMTVKGRLRRTIITESTR